MNYIKHRDDLNKCTKDEDKSLFLEQKPKSKYICKICGKDTTNRSCVCDICNVSYNFD